MNLLEVKTALSKLSDINFKLPDKTYVPKHFHVTEVALVVKRFIDCGGKERVDKVVNFQLWKSDDYDHRLAPQKLLNIINMSKKVIGEADDLNVEVEYQQSTIGKFDLMFDGVDFSLINKQTDCLDKDSCGITISQKKDLCCSSEGECC